jgi:hypothetical protein
MLTPYDRSDFVARLRWEWPECHPVDPPAWPIAIEAHAMPSARLRVVSRLAGHLADLEDQREALERLDRPPA